MGEWTSCTAVVLVVDMNTILVAGAPSNDCATIQMAELNLKPEIRVYYMVMQPY
jgi:hypothetical protein